MNGHRRLDVHVTQAGQPRAYADSIYAARLVFSYLAPDAIEHPRPTWEPPVETVRAVAAALVHPFVEVPRFALDARLELIDQVAPGVWDVLVRVPYAD